MSSVGGVVKPLDAGLKETRPEYEERKKREAAAAAAAAAAAGGEAAGLLLQRDPQQVQEHIQNNNAAIGHLREHVKETISKASKLDNDLKAAAIVGDLQSVELEAVYTLAVSAEIDDRFKASIASDAAAIAGRLQEQRSLVSPIDYSPVPPQLLSRPGGFTEEEKKIFTKASQILQEFQSLTVIPYASLDPDEKTRINVFIVQHLIDFHYSFLHSQTCRQHQHLQTYPQIELCCYQTMYHCHSFRHRLHQM